MPSASALFNTAPWDNVWNFKVVAPPEVVCVPPSNVKVVTVIEAPEPVWTVIALPAVPAVEADKCNAVVPSTALTPIPKSSLAPIFATKLSIAVAADDPVLTKNIGELSAGIADASDAINLYSVPPTVICNSSPSSSKKLFPHVNDPVAGLTRVVVAEAATLAVATVGLSPVTLTIVATPPNCKYLSAVCEVKYW